MGMVAAQAAMLHGRGVAAMQFGKLDKTDFLIPPLALFISILCSPIPFRLQKLRLGYKSSELARLIKVNPFTDRMSCE
jgi:hypothetical protein